MGQTHEAILAWRMLYSSVAKDNWPLYSDFLEGMDPRLRQSLKPMDVLHFWKRVGGFAADEPWMVVFAVDEVRTLGTVRCTVCLSVYSALM